MDIKMFLEAAHFPELPDHLHTGQFRLAQTVRFYHPDSDFPDLEGVQIAIIGLREERNAVNNMGCSQAPAAIRQHLYRLFHHWPGLQIADLGDIRPGHRIEDTYFAISQVVGFLVKQKIIPIVLGGSQDLTFALYQAYEQLGQLVNIVAVDPLFDLGQEEEKLSSQDYLSRIIMHQPNYLFNFTNIGYQTYLIDHKAVELMNSLLFDVYRLGFVRSKMEEAEPALRNADMLSFDISAIRAADAPGNGNAGPNGFTGDEACRIARYAGFSDKLSVFGVFEYNPLKDREQITAALLAQMIWYFMDGVASRTGDLPKPGNQDFTKYIVRIEGQQEDVVFLKSKKSLRWWIDLSLGRNDGSKFERHHYVPCSKDDYEQALRDELPDRWWQFYQKLM